MRVVEVYKRPGPAFSFEFFPPKTEQGLAKLYATIEHLSELNPAFVSVTYGSGGQTRGKTVEIAAHIRNEIGVEAVAHLTCEGHSKSELEDILSRLKGSGVENVLALRGDPPLGQSQFETPADGYAHAEHLVRLVRSNSDFCVGAACYPEGHVENPDKDDDLNRLVDKVNAGTDFLITQLFFDNSYYFDFVARARSKGVRVPIVPGLMPVTNVAQLERFTKLCGATVPEELQRRLEKVSDDEQAVMAVGTEWAIEQGRELLAGGAPGVHFFTINRSLATRIVCRSLMRW